MSVRDAGSIEKKIPLKGTNQHYNIQEKSAL